jgi:hypothetical protein
LLSLIVLTFGLLVGLLASAAHAHPSDRDESPVKLEATRVGSVSAPIDARETDRGVRFKVTETAVTTGDDIYMEETGRYRCTQIAEVIRCRGVVEGKGKILGERGTVRSFVSISCDLALNCEGRAVIKGVSGHLDDLWGTTTSTSSAGRAELDFRLYQI